MLKNIVAATLAVIAAQAGAAQITLGFTEPTFSFVDLATGAAIPSPVVYTGDGGGSGVISAAEGGARQFSCGSLCYGVQTTGPSVGLLSYSYSDRQFLVPSGVGITMSFQAFAAIDADPRDEVVASLEMALVDEVNVGRSWTLRTGDVFSEAVSLTEHNTTGRPLSMSWFNRHQLLRRD